MPQSQTPHQLLKTIFGFDSFRPLQSEIIEDFLNNRDVFALLPTGGGKSLCFQLPALVREGLTVVVSPLIALMKDQVDSLQAAGVAATFLNSTLDETDARTRLRGLYAGEYKLLYVAPERLLMPDFLARLKEWSVSALAIDEAHCISEWGHDFRPEYRRLSEVRSVLGSAPILALTATATSRVQDDIVRGLGLRDVRRYTASFNRPNLSYRVVAKDRSYQQLVSFLKERGDESGIVYGQSRRSVEQLAEKLMKDSFSARPYHAGLDPSVRSENQELFLRDEVKIICATVAFGMGINKPNVRYVVHYDLPKNIEGYYQETGRAGRDGLPSNCLLFFNAADVAKYRHFIREISDEHQRRVAESQLTQMVHFAETTECRRVSLLRYFGENFTTTNCGSCDNCVTPRGTFDGGIPARKFLACIHRIRERSGFSTGVGHVIDVLMGANTERIRGWGHETLSTYGIGVELKRNQWQALARDLIRQKLVRQNEERFNVVEITGEGYEALRSQSPINLIALPEGKVAKSARQTVTSIEKDFDQTLFDKLRALRKKLADNKRVPPYIIFGDVSLREMAQRRPRTKEEFREITGVGDKKLADYGELFLSEIGEGG
jgi:ATP-dependent DNA helicase RecQ